MKITHCTSRNILESCGLYGLNYQVDTYLGCEHLCYYCYALKNAETDWTSEIQAHKNIPESLGAELEGVPPQRIYMGYHSDPYQPCEKEALQTRKVLELFVEKGMSASILTKSDLVLRDIDLLKQMENAQVSVSVAFNNDQVRKQFEYKTIDTADRIEALRILKENGIRTNALICPVIPYLTDVVALVKELKPVANTIWIYKLSVEEGTVSFENVDRILETYFPDDRHRIMDMIADPEHGYWQKLRTQLESIGQILGIDLRIHL